MDVERSLSASKRKVTPDITSLGELTINGLRTVKDHVKVSVEPQNVKISKRLLQASRDAPKAHAKRLADEGRAGKKTENGRIRERVAVGN